MRHVQTVLMAAALAAVPAAAQVAPVSGAGQALDANYQIGSGGYNSVAGGVGGVNSQLFVTGQVTGLAAFRGRVPYTAPDELRLTLPSSELDMFLQQSVSLRQAVNRVSYETLPYYAPSQTVPGLRQLQTGQIDVGGPRQYLEASTAQRLYVDATADYSSLISLPPAQAVSAIPLIRTTGSPGLVADTGQRKTYVTAAVKPGATAFFNVPMLQAREELIRELVEMETPRESERVETGVDEKVRAQVPSGEGSRGLFEPPRGAGIPPAEGATGGELVAMPKVNQDVFLDMMLSLRARRLGLVPSGTALAEPGSLLRRPGESTPGETSSGLLMPEAGERKLVEISKERGIIVHGLAGANADQFNAQMAQAQEQLKQGRYYEAAGVFEICVTINSSNPLAEVGLGLSLLGAGEPYSAAHHLRRALALFPPIMETQIDVGAMMNRQAFDRQMIGLESRLDEEAGRNDRTLLFLATYLFQSSGQVDPARKYAGRLQEVAGDDPILKSLAVFVLTGQRPASQPTTRPTTRPS